MLNSIKQTAYNLLPDLTFSVQEDDKEGNYQVDIGQWFFFPRQHLSKLCTVVGVHVHDGAQKRDVVGRVAELLRVEDDLLELISFGETVDRLRRATMNLSPKFVDDTFKFGRLL